MKYAIRPVLAEIEEFVRSRGIDSMTDAEQEKYVQYLPKLTGAKALELLLKLYKANNPINHTYGE